jgi:2-isopropylmalate synthase
MTTIALYDTTLRDGTQAEEVAFSVEDKLRVAEKLDELGIGYIEGGWPGSNPRDEEFFQRAKGLKLKTARIAAFGSTRRAKLPPDEDPNLQALVASETPVITIFGKTWDFHVREALRIELEQNLTLIEDSVAYLKKYADEVIYDAEHFFDGYKNNPDYALETIKAAASGGADCLVLCDTNGGTLPSQLRLAVRAAKQAVPQGSFGIHCHNDSELAVANSLAAVEEGCYHVQGTINGVGERCGNANLCSIIPNLKIKMGYDCISDEQLGKLLRTSRFVYELANMRPWIHQPYVGKSAFAHKGGVHVSAIQRNPETYEHIRPELVGNVQRVLVSDLSGRSNVLYKAVEFGIDVESTDPTVISILDELKSLENQGFQFEGAEGSFELLVNRALGKRRKFFDLQGFRVVVEKRMEDEEPFCEATIMVNVAGEVEHTASCGKGPVNALDKALRKALEKFYPQLRGMHLTDYKVRILDERQGTEAVTRVLVESADDDVRWGTVGVSSNIIEASWQALVDSVEYKLHRDIP